MQERRNSSAIAMELRLSCMTHRYVPSVMIDGVIRRFDLFAIF